MKNEFVMVPRTDLVRLQENMDPHRGAVAWGIVCDLLAKPTEQHQGEPVERHTLLAKCREWIEAARDGVLYPIARDFDGVVGRNAEGLGQETPGLLDAIDAALSASAEPSAPVEIDEQVEFMTWANEEYQVGPDEELNMKNPSVRDNKIGWLARAALERKS